MRTRISIRLTTLIASTLLAGCMVGPDYTRPKVETPSRFKEARPLPGWQFGAPANADMPKGAWWTIYGDRVLDTLEDEVVRSNQSLRAQEAAYRQAVALVDEARGSLFPTVTLAPEVQRSGTGGKTSSFASTGITSAAGSGTNGVAGSTGSTGLGTTGLGANSGSGATAGTTGATGSTVTFNSGSATSTLELQGNVSWDVDLWGRVRRQVESEAAAAQASAATLANTRLSLEAQCATYYFELRSQDSLKRLLDRTVSDYQRNLDILHNQVQAGTGNPSDYLQALTTLRQAQASDVQVGIARAEYEHAIAVLTGHAPADLEVALGDLQNYVPEVPPGIPSDLLQRRPDIAEFERQVEEANAQIGVEIAAFYPDVTLSASGGWSGSQLSTLFSLANTVWSLGTTATETLFEGGIRSAAVRAARAQYDESVANYRQTVLTAFQGVEDQLAALRILKDQAEAERLAVEAANQSVRVALNEYNAGTESYTTVVTAETSALSDAETALTVQQDRLTASVTLVEDLGGGWDTSHVPSKDSLQTNEPFLPAFIDPTRVPAPG